VFDGQTLHVQSGVNIQFDASISINPGTNPTLYQWNFSDLPPENYSEDAVRTRYWSQAGSHTLNLGINDVGLPAADEFTLHIQVDDPDTGPLVQTGPLGGISDPRPTFTWTTTRDFGLHCSSTRQRYL
jgi:hypothetical protein